MDTQKKKIRGAHLWLLGCVLVSVFGFQNVRSQEATCANDEQGTSYYFVNGILTDFVGASLSTQMLSRELNAEEFLQASDRVSLAYNRTGGPIPLPLPQGAEDFIYDIVESLAQDIQTNIGSRLNERGETALELAFRIVVLGASASNVNLTFLNLPVIQNAVIEALSRFTKDVIGADEVEQHIARYRSDILVGEKVVLVAHSQGNFFANLAFADLLPEEQASVGIVSVANPDSQVGLKGCKEVAPGTISAVEVSACSFAGGESTWLSCDNGGPEYTTVCRDRVVNRLRSIYGNPFLAPIAPATKALPPNLFGPGGLDEIDSWWHGFRTVYLSANSVTRNRILNQIRETASRLVVPELRGDLRITGAVQFNENRTPIGGARVKVELIADALAGQSGGGSLFDGVVDAYTNEAGEYSLCVPSSALPKTILVSASSDGLIPQVRGLSNEGSGELRVDFLLDELRANTVVIELDPVIHHLGDDSFSGNINSQFQKLSEGIVYETSFFLTEEQRRARTATLRLFARGLELNNPLQINGETVAFLNSSPSDGSFGEVSLTILLGFFDLESGVQVLRIESARASFNDWDDFEFVNILLTLTFD